MTPIATKERPIIFGAESVRAILEGRKTMTRRVVKPTRHQRAYVAEVWKGETTPAEWNKMGALAGLAALARREASPFGRPSDRLWGREAWAVPGAVARSDDPVRPEMKVVYRADGESGHSWRSPIFMPRWASRITLEIESVRVERLQDISEKDCEAELGQTGFTPWGGRYSFGQAWNQMWEKRGLGWAANPWVWVLSFRKVEP